MPIPSAVVLVVDRLSQGFLGPYGNTVIRTPEFDSLAAESFVFDQALVVDPRPGPAYDALWGLAPPASLAAALAAAGVHACLMTDEPALVNHPLATDFAERELIAVDAPRRAARDLADTTLSQIFGAAADWIDSARAAFLLWVHARGMAAAWDAPYELRAAYADEEDPPPPDFVAVPDRLLPEDFDPDELLGITQAYCGQVAALDACLGMLRTAMAEAPLAASTLLCVLSSRGFPLGEHRRLGGDDAPLHAELVAIPWFLRLPGGEGALGRSPALVRHDDLPATLLAWWGIQAPRSPGGHDSLPLARQERDWVRQWSTISSGSGERAVRSPAWYLRSTESAHELRRETEPQRRIEPRLELYAKPSDRWEVNEVAARAPRIREALAALLARTPSNPDVADQNVATPLDAALLEPVD